MAAADRRTRRAQIKPDQVRVHKLVGQWVCLTLDEHGRPSGEVVVRDQVELYAGDERRFSAIASRVEAEFAETIAEQLNTSVS